MLSFHPTEREAIERDAAGGIGKSPQERMAMFADLMETVEIIQATLSPEERERRRRIAEQLDPRPDPWWKNFRPEALAEYQCRNSPT